MLEHNGLTAAPETHDRLHGEKVAFGTLAPLVLEGRPSSTVDEAMDFCLSVGLPVTLTELGLQNLSCEKAWAIAERAVAAGESAHNELFEVTAANLVDAIYAADAIGAAFKARTHRSKRNRALIENAPAVDVTSRRFCDPFALHLTETWPD